ncbi:MAG: FAD-dependent oxidoreductase [Anaerolineae bacterium]|nr:FAD-dependent oxidoreductase [Anaerolineae bacterium]
MRRERLVVIGGDAAGMSAASQARRLRDDLDIVVFERGPHTSYAACGIPYYVGGLVQEWRALVARTPDEFRQQGIDARVRHEVTEIDPQGHRVRVRNLDTGDAWWEPYDHLLIATGALPVRPAVPGADAEGIYGVHTLESGIRLRQIVDEGKARRVVIVGGGYIGLEMAEAMCLRGLETSLVQRGPQVMNTLDPDMGALVSDALRGIGTTLYLGEEVVAFDVKDGRLRAVITDKRELPADMAILGMGVRPNTELARAAGIPLGVKGAIRVNERMQTEVAGIWAAGDCAEIFHLVSRRPAHIPLGTTANKQGRVAGLNLGGRRAAFPGVVGTAVSKICSLEVARTGLQEKEIVELGLEFVSATVKSRTRAGYYPGAGTITVKVLAEKGTGRFLGGQIVGTEGAAKRIDVMAVALHAGMTVDEMIHLDLSYAPPFSPVWDPVLTAVRQIVKEV